GRQERNTDRAEHRRFRARGKRFCADRKQYFTHDCPHAARSAGDISDNYPLPTGRKRRHAVHRKNGLAGVMPMVGRRAKNAMRTPTAGVEMIEGLPLGAPRLAGTPDVARASAARTGAPVENVQSLELSIVIPCLNEARTLPIVVPKALNSLARLGIEGEVIV